MAMRLPAPIKDHLSEQLPATYRPLGMACDGFAAAGIHVAGSADCDALD